MINRSERCAFTASFHIGLAEIINSINACYLSQHRAIAELNGSAGCGVMINCLAMKADEINRHICLSGKRQNSCCMVFGNRSYQRFTPVWFSQPAARVRPGCNNGALNIRPIGKTTANAGTCRTYTVCADNTGINPVSRSARHQANNSQRCKRRSLYHLIHGLIIFKLCCLSTIS